MIRRQLVAAVVLTAIVAVTLGLLYPLAMAGVGAVAFPFRSGGSLIKQNGQVVGSALIGQNFLDKDGNALPQYFQPRPSASGANGYDPVGATCTPQLVGCGASASSNLGPGDPKLVGNVPGLNIDTKTNPYATPADPWCVPVQQTDKNNNPVSDKQGNPVYQKDKDGNYMCNPNTVPERAIAYRQLNNLPDKAKVPVDAVTASASGLDPDISVANARLQAARVAGARKVSVQAVLQLVDTHTNNRRFGFLGEKTINVLDLNLALDNLH
jgi:K+-transporting ATPase ATPase C chain